MTAQDFYAVCREHISFVHRGARFHEETGSVTVDVHTKPDFVQRRLCDSLAQSLGRKGRSVDVWLEGGIINIADKKERTMTFEDVKRLWDEFSEVPVDNDDRIERPFLHFEAGTDRFDVWRWFDEHCPRGMARDLLGMK